MRVNTKIIAIAIAAVVVVILAVLGSLKFTIWSHRESTTIRALDLSEIIFCSGEPQGENNYIVQPDNTYNAGGVVWVYFEACGVSSKEVNGKFEVYLTGSMKLLKDGNVLGIGPMEEVHPREEILVFDSYWFEACVGIPDNFPGGKYDVELTVTDHISSQIKSVSGSFYIVRELELSEIIFCSAEPQGPDDYAISPDSTYNAEDNVWMYLEAPMYDYQELDGEYEIHLTLSIRLLKDENVLANWPNLLEFNPRVENIVEGFTPWFKPWITTPHDFPAGRYDVEITVADHISSQTKSVSGSFHIE